MRAFTNGQWTYKAFIPEGVTLNGTEYLISSEGEEVALARKEADALLIAAAPDMYEAIRNLVGVHSSVNSQEQLLDAFLEMKFILERIDSEEA